MVRTELSSQDRATGLALLAAAKEGLDGVDSPAALSPDDLVAWSALADWTTEHVASGDYLPDEWQGSHEVARRAMADRKVWALASVAVNACYVLARTWQARSQCQNVQFHDCYAEPGYTDPASGLIATGDWNTVIIWDGDDIPKRLGDLLEALGVELEWGDEWSTCEECGGLVRTSPDTHGWTPHYREDLIEQGSMVCLDCAQPEDEEPEAPEDDEDWLPF